MSLRFSHPLRLRRPIARSHKALHRPLHFLRGADEAKALAEHGTDQALLFASVVDRPARSTDPGGERRFGYGSPTPYRLKHVVSADDPVPILEKKHEQVEHLRFQGQQIGSAAKLPPIRIQSK